MDNKAMKSTKFGPHKNKQPYHTLLNTNNKITYLITGQQATTVVEYWIHVLIRII